MITSNAGQNSQSCPALDMESGVYVLMGVNGVGKSSIAKQLSNLSESTVVVHASAELMKLFGNIDRCDLEALCPKEKLNRMEKHFIAIFENHLSAGDKVILDTHLLVPIRTGNTTVYENIWSDLYIPYIRDVIMIEAKPAAIRQWRLLDQRNTGRKRDLSIENIAFDQIQNISTFISLVDSGSLPKNSLIVHNYDCDMEKTCETIKKRIAKKTDLRS